MYCTVLYSLNTVSGLATWKHPHHTYRHNTKYDICLPILFRRNNNWKFEYTGDPEPLAGPGKEDGSDEMSFTGSTGYKNMMGLDITGKEASKRPAAMNLVRKIPANCTTDEVLAAVKSAMFEMSDWLLQVEAVEINSKRSGLQDEDDDLLEDTDTAHLNMHLRRSSPSPSSDPYLESYLDPLNHLLTVTGDGSKQLQGLYAVQGQDSSARLTVSKKGGHQHQQQVQHRSISRCRGIEEGNENENDNENENEEYEEERERENRRGNDEDVSEGYDSDENMSSSPPGYEDRDLYQPPSSSPSPFLALAPSASDTSIRSSAHSQVPSHTLINTSTHTRTRTRTRTGVPSDRVSIMFSAFTDATNNKAQWLGKNKKLTRLKFQGGIEKVLRLKMTWQQFDSLWTRVDKQRSGDLSFQEFQNAFYNADDMFSSEGTYDAYVRQDTCSFLLLTICIHSLCRYCFIVYHLSVSDY